MDQDFQGVEFGMPTWPEPLLRRRARTKAGPVKHPADRPLRRVWDASGNQPTFLYVAFCKGFAKIGVSKDVKLRLAGMQACCPFEITLLECWPLSKADALQAEMNVFQALRAHHTRGEWFACSPAKARHVALQAIRMFQPAVLQPKVSKKGWVKKPRNAGSVPDIQA